MRITSVLAMAVSFTTALTPFLAPPEDESVSAPLEAVHSVAPALTNAVPFTEDGARASNLLSTAATGGGPEVALNSTQDSVAIDLVNADSSVTLDVSLPLSGDAVTRTVDGAAVSESTTLGLAQVTEASDAGVRMTSVAADAQALGSLEYVFDGAVLFESEDGSVTVGVPGEHGGALVVGEIHAPWATDADGAELETYYSVDGQLLTQHVAVDADTAYPVVADPYFVWTNSTNNFEIRWTRAETISLANGGFGPAFDFAVKCAAFPLPPSAKAALYGTCLQAYASFVAAAKIQAANGYGCIKINGDTSPVWVLGPLPYTCVKRG